MKGLAQKLGIAVLGATFAYSASTAKAAAPEYGGNLNIVVGSKIPSYDGHIESTFGMIHPIRPFYSLLIRENPDNPASPTDFVCDLCVGDVPKGTEGGTKYTFKIRTGVKFHDGTPLTSADIKATFDKIRMISKISRSSHFDYKASEIHLFSSFKSVSYRFM